MSTLSISEPSSQLMHEWWHHCSSTACSLPQEHTQEWLNLISDVVRNYRLLLHSAGPRDIRIFRTRCRQALVKSRWELMLISMYGYIPQEQVQSLEKLQCALESSLDS